MTPMQRLRSLGVERRTHGVGHLAVIRRPSLDGLEDRVRAHAKTFGRRPRGARRFAPKPPDDNPGPFSFRVYEASFIASGGQPYQDIRQGGPSTGVRTPILLFQRAVPLFGRRWAADAASERRDAYTRR